MKTSVMRIQKIICKKGGKEINNARQVACCAKFICREVKLDYRQQTSRSGKKFQV